MKPCGHCHSTHAFAEQVTFTCHGHNYRANVQEVVGVYDVDPVMGDATMRVKLCIVEIRAS